MNLFDACPKIFFGADALGYLDDMQATRAMLVTDPYMVKSGASQTVTGRLEGRGIRCAVFSGVEPDPSIETVAAGVGACFHEKPDAIVALGGGSAIDAAKAILYFCMKCKSALMDEKYVHKPHFVAIPTTSGTGSEVTGYSVITDRRANVKLPLTDRCMIPDVAILCPAYTESLPKQMVAFTGMDVLTHALEAYMTKAASAFTDMHALEAARKVLKYLPLAWAGDSGGSGDGSGSGGGGGGSGRSDGNGGSGSGRSDGNGGSGSGRSYGSDGSRIDGSGDGSGSGGSSGSGGQAPEQMMIASTMAGLAFNNSGLGVCHGLAHSVGALFHIPHGKANSIILPYAIAFNAGLEGYAPQPAALARYALMCRRIGHGFGLAAEGDAEAAGRLLAAVRNLGAMFGIPASLKEDGIPREDYYERMDRLAEQVLRDITTQANPVPVRKEDALRLLADIYEGRGG